jgi:hypothetical protein
MKRKLSLLMVLMMMLTLIPANMAFAASDATVNTEVASANGTVPFEIEIEPKGTGFKDGGIFELMLGENAEWNKAFSTHEGVTPEKSEDYVGEQRAEFTVNLSELTTGGSIIIKGEVKLDGAETGDQKVTIENINDSGVSRQVLTYAVVSGSGEVVSRRLGSVESLTRGTGTASKFELREVDSSAMEESATGTFKLRLPKDVEWKTGTKIHFNGTADANELTIKNGLNSREIEVGFNSDNVPDDDNIDRIVVTPVIDLTKDAKFGDIEVEIIDVNSGVDADDVLIAKYNDYAIALKVDKTQSIVAGKDSKSKDYVVEVTLDAPGPSFITGRPIDFTVSGGDVRLKKVVSASSVATISNEIQGLDNGFEKYDDEFDIQIDSATADEFKFELYLKADWDSAGELTLTGKGGGMEEQTIKLADVLAPARITTKAANDKTVADVVVGLQNQAAPTIIIEETEAGSLQEGYYVIDFGDSSAAAVELIDKNVKFETTGDISVDDVYTIEKGDKLVVYIDGESNKEASKITITGLEVSLNRSVPYGNIDARFGAVVDEDGNFNVDPEDEKDYEVEDIIAKLPLINVVTEVQTARRQKTVFTLDSATYTVGSETKTLDAAPYISNNRTMLPIGTVAQLAGATLNYSPATRTAVFTKDNLVVSMNLDTNILLVNGSPVPMDAKPEIVNDRAFVSVVYVAQAFGIQNGTDIVYDAASRTVTLFPNAQ